MNEHLMEARTTNPLKVLSDAGHAFGESPACTHVLSRGSGLALAQDTVTSDS